MSEPAVKRGKKPATVLVMRTVRADGSSYDGFRWPLTVGAEVVAPDWMPTKMCGNGLHGLLWGCGDGSLLDWSNDAHWLVLEVARDSIVDLGGKVKFPFCRIAHVGDRTTAPAYIAERAPNGSAVVAFIATAGYRGIATAGDRGTATAGDCGTATAGDCGIATAGDRGTATAGDCGTATAGYRGIATAGYRGIATAGDRGTATAGYRGTATAGDCGTATAGDCGTATAGDRGIATAGDRGTIAIHWWDGSRYRFAVGYVGEGGIKRNTKYRVEGAGVLTEVKE